MGNEMRFNIELILKVTSPDDPKFYSETSQKTGNLSKTSMLQVEDEGIALLTKLKKVSE